MSESRLAVIKAVRLGYHPDFKEMAMSFSTYITESLASEQHLIGEDLKKAFADTRAINAQWFEGKACWVEYDDDSRIIIYKRMFGEY